MRGPKATSMRPASGARGIALVLVLWVLAILALLALSLAYGVRVSTRATDNGASSVEAYFAAYSGLERSLVELEANVNGFDSTDESWSSLDSEDEQLLPGEVEYHVRVSDECGKLNLNTATREQLLSLPGVDEGIADSVIDWRDEDSQQSPQGAEDDYYQKLSPPYHCANRPFRTVDELLLVKGVDPLLLYGQAEQEERLTPTEQALADLRAEELVPQTGQAGRSPTSSSGTAQKVPPLIELVTVTSRAREMASDGELRLDLRKASQQQLSQRLADDLTDADTQAIADYVKENSSLRSVSALWNVAGMTREKMAVVVDKLSVRPEATGTAGPAVPGGAPSGSPTGPTPGTGGTSGLPGGSGSGPAVPGPQPTSWRGEVGVFYLAQVGGPTAPGGGAPTLGPPGEGAPGGAAPTEAAPGEAPSGEAAAGPPLMEEPVAGLVNINTAAPEVLMCLPGMTEQAATALLRQRAQSPFQSRGAILMPALEKQIDRALFDRIIDLITVTSDTYRISSLGQVGDTGIVSHLTAVVEMAGGESRLAYIRQDS